MFSPFKWWQNWTESWHWYVAVGSAHQSAKTYHNTTLSSHGYSATRQMNVCLLETQICRFETIKSVEYRCKILVPLDIDGKTLFLVKTGLLGDSTGIPAFKCHRYWRRIGRSVCHLFYDMEPPNLLAEICMVLWRLRSFPPLYHIQ